MPELPEVETIVRTLAPGVVGKRITAVSVEYPKVIQGGEPLLESLCGGTVEEVFRRAKLLLLRIAPAQAGFEGGLLAAFHLKMTGRFFIHPPGTAPLKHTRLVFDLEDGGRLFFDDMRKFGYCRIMRPGELHDWPFWAALGPEPLEGSAEELAAHFSRYFSRRGAAVKGLLLDQRCVAGVGNIYADESLFKAGIHPAARASSISGAALLRLSEALRATLRQSIEECGSSIRDYRDAQGNAGAFQNSFAVYGRKGEQCRTCGGPLESTRVAGRGTVLCPVCQKE